MEFKRGIWSFIKSLTVALVAPIALFFVVSIFTDNLLILAGLSALAFLFLIYSTIFSENIKFVIEGDILNYYKMSKLKTYNLKDYVVGYNAKTTDGDPDHIYLELVGKESGEELSIDCTALGLSKFYQMYELIESTSITKSTKIETKKKGK